MDRGVPAWEPEPVFPELFAALGELSPVVPVFVVEPLDDPPPVFPEVPELDWLPPDDEFALPWPLDPVCGDDEAGGVLLPPLVAATAMPTTRASATAPAPTSAHTRRPVCEAVLGAAAE